MASGSASPPAFLSISFVLPSRAALLLQVEILHVVLGVVRREEGAVQLLPGGERTDKRAEISLVKESKQDTSPYRSTTLVVSCLLLPASPGSFFVLLLVFSLPSYARA